MLVDRGNDNITNIHRGEAEMNICDIIICRGQLAFHIIAH